MISKKGKAYYSVIRVGEKLHWIALHTGNSKTAARMDESITAAVRRERAQKTLTKAILSLAVHLARKEADKNALLDPLAQIEKTATLAALDVIGDMLPLPAMLASDIWDRYVKSPEKDLLEPSTFRTKRIRSARFIAWAGDMDMRSFTAIDAEKFLKSLGTEKTQTWNNYVCALSSIWKSCPDLDNPWTPAIKKHTSNVENKQPFTLEETRMILAFCSESLSSAKSEEEKKRFTFWKFFVISCYHASFRLKDVVYFNAFNVSPDGYYISAPYKTRKKTKEKKAVAEIRTQLREAIQALPTPDHRGFYFPDMIKKYEANGGSSLVDKDFIRILHDCGITRPHVGTHCLRHTFVTTAIDAGNDAEEVAAIAGHSATTLTLGTYYHGKKKTHLENFPDL